MIKLLLKDILYAGLTLGPCLTLLEVLNNASNIKLFAFTSGSFFIIQILQFNKVSSVNKKHLDDFLLHSIIGGISWVLLAVIMYTLNKSNYSKNKILIISIFLIILQVLCSVIYYKYFDK